MQLNKQETAIWLLHDNLHSVLPNTGALHASTPVVVNSFECQDSQPDEGTLDLARRFELRCESLHSLNSWMSSAGIQCTDKAL